MHEILYGDSPLPIDKSSLKTYVLVLCVSSCECIDKLSFVLSNSLVHCLNAFLMKVTICLQLLFTSLITS
jgi:hypothetical protein